MTEALARELRFPWTMDATVGGNGGKLKGWFKMKVGTFKFLFPLGLENAGPEDYTDTYNIGAKTYRRALYAGGPTIQVTRPAQTIIRTRSYKASTAASEKKLIISERGVIGGSQDTIYYTGPVHGAVSYLKEKCALIAGGGIQIEGPHGQAYLHVDAIINTPTV
jgi:hypothetical protein